MSAAIALDDGVPVIKPRVSIEECLVERGHAQVRTLADSTFRPRKCRPRLNLAFGELKPPKGHRSICGDKAGAGAA